MKSVNYQLFGLLLLLLAYSCSKSDNNPSNNNTTNNHTLRLIGSVKSCNGINLTNGKLNIFTNSGYVSVPITNGSLDTTLQSIHRFDSILVWAVDLDSLTTSDTLLLEVPGESMNLGQISTCAGEVDEYIKCKIDNESFVFVPNLFDSLSVSSWDTLSSPATYFYREDGPFHSKEFYQMQFPGMAMGNFSVYGNSRIVIGRYYCYSLPASGNITYTSYGNIGDYITGTVNVPFIDVTDSLNHLLIGSFKVRRDR